MKPIPSVLKIVDFSVIEMNFEFIAPEDSEITISPISNFENYELDLDFFVFEHDYFEIMMNVDINVSDRPLPGYKISAKVATLFLFEDTGSITEDEKNSIEGFSTVYIALNNLRGIISGFTANAPFGRYTLPSIDLNDLIRKKKELTKQAELDAIEPENKKLDHLRKKNKKRRKNV